MLQGRNTDSLKWKWTQSGFFCVWCCCQQLLWDWHSCRSLLTKRKVCWGWKCNRIEGDNRGTQELSRRFVSREKCQFVEEIDCIGQKLEGAVANEPGVELENPRQGCCESCMLLSKCPLILLILHCFFFLLSPGKMPSGIKTNIKSASMHPYQRWAEMNQTWRTAAFVPLQASTWIPSRTSKSLPYPHTISGKTGFVRPFSEFYLVLSGLCEAAAGPVSWTQVLLVYYDSQSRGLIDTIFSRPAWRITTLCWYRTWRAAQSSLFVLVDLVCYFSTPSCVIKTLLCSL